MRLGGIKLNSIVKKHGLIKDNTCLYSVCFTSGIMIAMDDEEEQPDHLTNPLSGTREHVDTLPGMRTDRVEKIERIGDRNEEALGSNTSHFQASSGMYLTTTFGSVIKMKRLISGIQSKKSIGVYLADTRGFLHVYKVYNH